MTNHERYKQAFSTLHVSDHFHVEVTDMKKHKTLRLNRVAALAAALILAIGCMSVAYATDVGGIQEKVQIWINGEAVDANLTKISDLEYQITYPDSSGAEEEVAFGGVAINDDGTTTALDEDTLLDALNSGNVYQDEDGRVWLCYYDQKKDITDQFDENGECRVTLEHDGQNIYFLIRDEGDGCYPFSSSNTGYEELENDVDDDGETITTTTRTIETDD